MMRKHKTFYMLEGHGLIEQSLREMDAEYGPQGHRFDADRWRRDQPDWFQKVMRVKPAEFRRLTNTKKGDE